MSRQCRVSRAMLHADRRHRDMASIAIATIARRQRICVAGQSNVTRRLYKAWLQVRYRHRRGQASCQAFRSARCMECGCKAGKHRGRHELQGHCGIPWRACVWMESPRHRPANAMVGSCGDDLQRCSCGVCRQCAGIGDSQRTRSEPYKTYTNLTKAYAQAGRVY